MDAQLALAELQTPHELSILTLAEPFLRAGIHNPEDGANRSSNASSASGREGATPAILSADLAHYQELFSKLRFSYVEQVTKERFLRAITAEQPEFVQPAENAALEEKLRNDKAALKEKKVELLELIQALEEQGRSLAARYENVRLQTSQLEALPDSIASLESSIQQLRQTQLPKSDNPALSMSLQPTLEVLGQREDQVAGLDRQIEALRAALPHKQDEASVLSDEVSILNTRKIKAVEEAKEARRRRENGGIGDELDEKGRWLRGVDSTMRTILQA